MKLDKIEQASLAVLHGLSGLTGKMIRQIYEKLGSYTVVWNASAEKLTHIGLPSEMVQHILDKQEDLERMLTFLENQQIEVVTAEDERYPDSFMHIGQAPYILYYKGCSDLVNRLCLAVVGSRQATIYGKNTAFSFAQELSRHEIVVVSGLARGIDTRAHEGSLSGGGNTIAILGTGLDVIYPRENDKLYYQIVSQEGLIISEFPFGTPPLGRNFPRRNRLIAGLSRGIIVVEASERSGALITADFALEQGKDVYAVPGAINNVQSKGTNQLIRQGACLVTDIYDVLAEYTCVYKNKHPADKPQAALNGDEKSVTDLLGSEPVHMERIMAETQFHIGKLSEILFNLEMGGLVKKLPGNYYIKMMNKFN